MMDTRPRCCACYSIQDVQPMREIFMQDDGMRNGHHFAIYAYGRPQPYCARCRHRFAAFERLVGIKQRRGEDIQWLGENQ